MACKKNTYIVVETQLKVCHCHAEWLFLASSQSSCPPKHNKETPTAFEIALAMLNKNGQHDKGYNNKKCRWKRITHKRINKNVALPQYAICLRDAMHIRLYFGRTFRAKKKENISNKGSNNNNKSEGILYVKSSLCVYQLCVCVRVRVYLCEDAKRNPFCATQTTECVSLEIALPITNWWAFQITVHSSCSLKRGCELEHQLALSGVASHTIHQRCCRTAFLCMFVCFCNFDIIYFLSTQENTIAQQPNSWSCRKRYGSFRLTQTYNASS